MIQQYTGIPLVSDRILKQNAKTRYPKETALDLMTGLTDKCGIQMSRVFPSMQRGCIIASVRSQDKCFNDTKVMIPFIIIK